MTTPIPGQQASASNADDYSQRLIAAGQAVGTDKPRLATTLAASGVSTSDMQLIGQFATSLKLQATNQLAQDSGAATDFTPEEQQAVLAVGGSLPNQPAPGTGAGTLLPAHAAAGNSGGGFLESALGWLGKTLSSTGNLLIHNPVSEGILKGLDFVSNVAHMPVRILSGDIGGVDSEEMKALGYDPNSETSKIAFEWSHPNSDYHSLEGVRQKFGEDAVNVAIQQQSNPDAFNAALANGTIWNSDGSTTKVDLTTDEGKQAMQAFTSKLNSGTFQAAAQAVDAQHISPGRDLAGLIVNAFGGSKSESNPVFKLLSGTLDAAYDWASDPMLMVGRVAQGMRMADVLGRDMEVGGAMRTAMQNKVYTPLSKVVPKVVWGPGFRPYTVSRAAGLKDMNDQVGIDALFAVDEQGRPKTATGALFHSFIQDNNKLNDLADETAKAVGDAKDLAFQRQGAQMAYMQKKYNTLMVFQDELNGRRVLPPDIAKIVHNPDGGKAVTDPLLVDKVGTAHAANKAGVRLPDGNGGVRDVQPEDIEPVVLDGVPGVQAPGTGVAHQARLAEGGDKITDLNQWRDYFRSTDGLMRMTGGEAAQLSVVMPYRMSFTSELKARMAMRGANKDQIASSFPKVGKITNPPTGKVVFDYSKPNTLLPHDAEQSLLSALDENPTEDNPTKLSEYAAARGRLQYASTLVGNQVVRGNFIQAVKNARNRWEQFTRRVTAMQPPKDGIIRWSDPNSTRIVHQSGLLYLNRGDAARLAAVYATANNAVRRQIVEGALQPQLMHATGVFRSDAGRKWGETFLSDQDRLAQQKYGMGDTSKLTAGQSAAERQAALYPNQLRDFSVMPNFKDLHYYAGKFAVGNWAQRAGLASLRSLDESNVMDNLMHAIKLGWITTAASGMRNGIEEMSTVLAKGLGPAWLKGRVLFTQSTQNIRAEKRQAARDLIALKNKYGDKTMAFEEATSQAQESVKGYAGLKAELDKVQARIDADNTIDVSDPAAQAKRLEPLEKAELLAQRDQLVADIPDAEKEARQAVLMTRAISHRIPLYLRGATDKMNDVFWGSIVGRVMSLTGRMPTEEEIKYAGELINTEITGVLKEGVFSSQEAEDVINKLVQPMAFHRLGLMARQMRFPQGEYLGWKQVEMDGGSGLENWARRLGIQYTGASPAHPFAQKMLETNDPMQAREAVREWLDSPEAAHFVRNAEHAWTLRDGSTAITPEQRKLALDQLADRQTADLLLTISKRGIDNPVHDSLDKNALYNFTPVEGGINEDLLKRLAQAKDVGAPDRSWLANNVPVADRPEHTIGQVWAPFNPAHPPEHMPSGYTQMLTKAYGKVSIDMINAITRNPLFTGLYINARKATAKYEDYLVSQGWDRSVAERTAQHISLNHAQTEIFRHVDNPYIGTQMSTVARNFWAFERFQEDFVRRWGRTLRDNPDVIRKFQLAIGAAQGAGILEKAPGSNGENNLQFVYPGSGMAIGLMNKVLGLVGSNVKIPIMGDLTSNLNYLNASMENPLGFTGTPLVTIPVDAMVSMMGADASVLGSSLKQAAEGNIGASKKWYEEMLPESINRILEGPAASMDDPHSQLGSAFVQALYTLEANGQLAGIDKNGLDANAIAMIQQQVASATRNALTTNLLGGFILPAAPSVQWSAPTAKGADEFGHTHQGNEADWSFHQAGYESLQDEFKAAAAEVGYQQARVWWEATHPGELIWDQAGAGARTQGESKQAAMPATIVAAQWMDNNHQFVDDYRNIASYFMPAGGDPAQQQYSDVAYRAQLEAGLRSYKPLEQFLPDIIVQRGEQLYSDAVKPLNDGIKQALAIGDEGTARNLEAAKAALRSPNGPLAQSNPLWADKMQSVETGQKAAQLSALRTLVTDNSASALKALGGLRPGIEALLQAYDEYQAVVGPYAGAFSSPATKVRQKAQAEFNDRVQAIVGTTQQPGPYAELQDLARGVFGGTVN